LKFKQSTEIENEYDDENQKAIFEPVSKLLT